MLSRILFAIEKGIDASERKIAGGIWSRSETGIGSAGTMKHLCNSVNTLSKPKTPRDKKYLEWISGIRCCACGSRSPSDPHHVNSGGKGIKCSDYEAIPLCHRHHQELHTIGKKTFAIKYGLDYNSIIERLNQIWQDMQE